VASQPPSSGTEIIRCPGGGVFYGNHGAHAPESVYEGATGFSVQMAPEGGTSDQNDHATYLPADAASVHGVPTDAQRALGAKSRARAQEMRSAHLLGEETAGPA
jgi:hypothetical protein